MPKESIFWKHKKAVKLYHKKFSKGSSGVTDEKHIKEFITTLKKGVKVVSLGIGSGRELNWLDELKNVKEIIGIDYSDDFLNICREVAAECKIRVTLIKDNLFSLRKLKRVVKNEKLPLIYVCLINTLGNFEEKERKKVLKNVKNLMRKKDRLILALYKRPNEIKTRMFLPPQIRLRGGLERKIKLGTLIEYSHFDFFWLSTFEKYHCFPRFWYNDKTDDVTVYVGKEKILISHRFSKEEIKELAQKTKFKIEKLIEGKFMWTTILRI